MIINSYGPSRPPYFAELYYALLKKLSELMADVKTLFEYEIEKLSSPNNVGYRELI